MLNIFMYALIIIGAGVGVWALWNENASDSKDKDEKDMSSGKEDKNKK